MPQWQGPHLILGQATRVFRYGDFGFHSVLTLEPSNRAGERRGNALDSCLGGYRFGCLPEHLLNEVTAFR